jgi:hypothetical protein
MKHLLKPAIVLGIAGVMTLGSLSASQARVRPWVASAAGFAAGAAIGAAAANANSYYYDGGYYDGGYYDTAYYGDSYAYDRPAVAYTGDPAYTGYNAYAYAPSYRSYGYGYDARTQSWPPHRDPGYGYNSNTLAPWQDRKMQGSDY